MKINSVHGFTWNVEVHSLKELSKGDIHFIGNFAPHIYWNDSGCYHFAFDTKLPSGRWLENIFPNNELTEVKALVC